VRSKVIEVHYGPKERIHHTKVAGVPEDGIEGRSYRIEACPGTSGETTMRRRTYDAGSPQKGRVIIMVGFEEQAVGERSRK